MNFNIGDHLQEIETTYHGYVTDADEVSINNIDENWYLLENNELGLVNHWVTESKLKLHKQPLRENKLNQLGIK